MATATTNLSNYDKKSLPDASEMTFGIVVSEWNNEITFSLSDGTVKTLMENGVKKEHIIEKKIPGSYELPQAAQFMLEYTSVDAVICLGSVIRGETAHFDYVCQAVAQGLKDVGLKYNKPVIFGVLTDDTLQQAKDRSGGKHGNKGDEAAVAAIKMVHLQKSLRKEGR